MSPSCLHNSGACPLAVIGRDQKNNTRPCATRTTIDGSISEQKQLRGLRGSFGFRAFLLPSRRRARRALCVSDYRAESCLTRGDVLAPLRPVTRYGLPDGTSALLQKHFKRTVGCITYEEVANPDARGIGTSWRRKFSGRLKRRKSTQRIVCLRSNDTVSLCNVSASSAGIKVP